jgi:hypothetical protein
VPGVKEVRVGALLEASVAEEETSHQPFDFCVWRKY